MKKIFILSILSIITLSGCAVNNIEETVQIEPINTKETVILSEQSQDVEFYIIDGITGGMGSMMVENHNQTLPVFFDESYADEVSKKVPGCVVGTPEIKISAKVHLQKKTGINESIPPDEFGNQSEETYYKLVVDELYNIEVKAEECED